MASDKGLCGVLFENGRHNDKLHLDNIQKDDLHPILKQAEKQLAEYFAGKRHDST